MVSIVIDTNVFVSALRASATSGGASRAVLRAALTGRFIPLFGTALWMEYEDLLSRPVWTDRTTHAERVELLKALAAVGQWVTIYYGWRPNLLDEGGNHLVELAIAGGAQAIVTFNVKDFGGGQLNWPQLRIVTPKQCLEVFS
ncbi:MAG: PIN domain-containing protein [Methylobacteriaceae bacterium]|jgi:predicted nucleic acid-binding protein|nr:PIN domain-containing protein [Methylobacteriaceae bacterium]